MGNNRSETPHTHSDSCYTSELTCKRDEHTHSGVCRDVAGNTLCSMREHTHGSGCYQKKKICGH